MEGGREKHPEEQTQQPAGTLPVEQTPDWTEQRPEIVPRIYVASLSDYNAGRLHGAWLEAAQEPEELEAGISAMLATSREPGAEEWAIHDYEGFGSLHLGEYESVERLSRLARGIADYRLPFAHWASIVGDDAEELGRFEEVYQGKWTSLRAYAWDILEDYGIEELLDRHVPEGLRPYVRVDADGFGRDLELSGDIITFGDVGSDGGVYVFRGW